MKQTLALAALIALASVAAFGLEGKWTPQQVLQLDSAWLKQQGLEIPASKLWDPKTGTGLMTAVVNTSGCSGGFISSDGLFITNHHCLFSFLQENATPENDIITNGFLARTRDAELRSKTQRITIPRQFTDVTATVLAAIPNNADDAARQKAIDQKQNALVAECEKRPATRCRVAAYDGGVQYTLVDSLEISDVRLVYAPPRSVGEYGGETDNWMWPRHTGDFSIARAWVDGKPYEPPVWFPISTKGAQPGDFVMVVGYPGTTYRSLTADEMVERRDFFFTRRRDVSREWIAILEDTTRNDPAGAIAVADNLKSLYNRAKNAEGQLAGFQRGSIVEKQRAKDQAVLSSTSTPRASLAAYTELQRLTGEKLKSWDRDFLLSQVESDSPSAAPLGPKALVFATTVARAATERLRPEAARGVLYTARNIVRARERMEREEKNTFAPADKRIFASFVMRTKALPEDQRIGSLERTFGSATTQKAVLARVEELYADTRIFDLAERLKMMDETQEQLRARRDPLVDLGLAMAGELRDSEQRRERWNGAVGRLRPLWRRAIIDASPAPLAFDANSTLRISFAHVQGYSPRDGVFYVPQTTISGILEKDSGVDPFNAPQRVLAAAREKRFGPWRDAKLDDVPVCFLADADTTGGNSGSPVLNGRGELVGVNFDRVWENVANDFGYNPAVNRNISVEVRYVLWILDQVEGASELVKGVTGK